VPDLALLEAVEQRQVHVAQEHERARRAGEGSSGVEAWHRGQLALEAVRAGVDRHGVPRCVHRSWHVLVRDRDDDLVDDERLGADRAGRATVERNVGGGLDEKLGRGLEGIAEMARPCQQAGHDARQCVRLDADRHRRPLEQASTIVPSA
jgi:hypothetical protein